MSNFIHPTCVIDPKVVIGDDNYFGPYCVISGNVKIGNGNRFEAYCSIGAPAEHRDYFKNFEGQVLIGNDNIFREFVTVNASIKIETTVSNECSLLKGSHVGHDAVLKDKVNLGCNVIIGGHTIVDIGANIGLSSVVHQRRFVGAYSMVGMNSTVTRNVLPFSIYFGSPAELKKLNRIGLQRSGVSNESLRIFDDWFDVQNQSLDHKAALQHAYEAHLADYFKFRRENHLSQI